ncbi:MAG: cyclic nucleotide-binding domain-containing protein [Gemmatimonadota bacterium]
MERPPGVGAVAAERLCGLGMRTIGQPARVTSDDLRQALGRRGDLLCRLFRSIDEEPVLPEREPRHLSQERTFAELGPGELPGELTTLDPEPHSALATATEESQLLGLDRDTLCGLMSSHVQARRGLIHTRCQRLRAKGRRPQQTRTRRGSCGLYLCRAGWNSPTL